MSWNLPAVALAPADGTAEFAAAADVRGGRVTFDKDEAPATLLRSRDSPERKKLLSVFKQFTFAVSVSSLFGIQQNVLAISGAST